MPRKPNDYWEKRSTQLMLENERDTKYTIKDILNIYNQATNNINKEIERIYRNYAKDGVLSEGALLKMLNTKETKTHYDNLLYVINNHIQNNDLKKKLLAKYNAPAYSYRISRLQALQDNIDIEMNKITTLEQKVTKVRYVNTVEKSYYKNIYNIQKGVGVGFDFTHLNTKALKILLAHRWIEGKNYSQRIWVNVEKLGNYLKTNLTAGMITGSSVQKMSKDLSEYMNVGMFNATRLVRTEVNHFTNEATALAYEECGIDRYQFSATLDIKTCDRCAALDNKIFNIKDKKIGVNYPPMHPNDRCTTTPYIGEDGIKGLKRRARDKNGNYTEVPADMDWQEWKSKYIDMTDEEKNAIKWYSGPDSYLFNEKMRNSTQLTQKEIKLTNNIDSALDKLPNYEKITYRQIGFDLQGKEAYNKFISQHKEGNLISYDQFISSSKSYNDYEVEDGLKAYITINGKTGKDLRGLVGIAEENEVLFKKDILFKVTKVENNKIWLEEI